jgi:2'-hydroxyisoflavone reductase
VRLLPAPGPLAGRRARRPRRPARLHLQRLGVLASVPWDYDESAPLAEVTEPDAEQVTNENYGGLKVACERLATALHGAGTTIIRPTYVIGPHDRSYRFTWWVDRIASGGRVLAPGDPGDPIQLIDARDMASWIVSMLERSVTGTFHAVNPAPPFTFGEMLSAIVAEVAPPGTELAWVPSDFLLAMDVTEGEMPLWPAGDAEGANLSAANPAAAFAAGLSPRPLRDTIADIAAEDRVPGSGRPGVGIAPDREAAVLAAWAARSG